MPAASAAGATNIKFASVTGFAPGQTIRIDTGANQETATIATVGTAGATTAGAATDVGATVIPVAGAIGFSAGQTISVDSGANHETAVVVSATGGRGGARITLAKPLTFAHAAGAQISGSGITLTAALTRAHDSGAQVASDAPTPGAPNKYSTKRNGRLPVGARPTVAEADGCFRPDHCIRPQKATTSWGRGIAVNFFISGYCPGACCKKAGPRGLRD
jgi:hypothetical protein